jgi:hypothetical protein
MMEDPVNPFPVNQAAQEALARVRTNLDAFSKLEAWALAKDGHAIATWVTPLRPAVAALGTPVAGPVAWPWDGVDLAQPSAKLLSVLAQGKREVWGLFAPLGLMVLAAIALIGVFLHAHGWWIFGIAVSTLAALGLYVGPKVRVVSNLLLESVVAALLALPLFVSAVVLLGVGRLWLYYGRVGSG